jgi:DNA polymerase III subunit gamma/tau
MSVFHLKYRPGLIAELDSVKAAESLRKILEAKEMPQSFLFAGPKGSGKTSAARILAKALNCNAKKNGEACGKCETCKSILEGKEIDVIEIDAASNRGIEDVRVLKERAYLMPSKLDKKIFIIDEVHMLTKDAFNALLKLIEEPPKHSVFILCTTDPEKIPETVLSRLTRIDFRKGTKKELLGALKKIVKGEKLKVDEKVSDFIVNKSDGSFRNLHRGFNELILNLGESLDLAMVEKFYKSYNGDYDENDLENDLVKGDLKLVLERMESLSELGIDWQAFNQRLLSYFQSKLLLTYGVGEGEKSELPLKELELLIKLLVRASKDIKEVEIGQLPLELAVIDFMSLSGNRSKQEVKEEVQVEKKEEVKIEKKEEAKQEIKEVEKKVTKEIKKEEVKVEESSDKKIYPDEKIDLDLAKIESRWGNLLLAVKPFNHSVEAFLRATRPSKIVGGELVLEVFYPFHKDRLEEDKNRKIVEEGLLNVFGIVLTFSCVLSKGRKKALIIDNKTPTETISEDLVNKEKEDKKDLYDVAKDIFG